MSSNKGHDNLIPLSKRAKEMQREIQSMGGIARGVKLRQQKKDQEKLELFAEVLKRRLKAKLPNSTKAQNWEGLVNSLVDEGLKGNIKALELILRIMGQMPTEKLDLTIKEPRRFVFELKK